MQMIRQHHPPMDGEWMRPSNLSEHITQETDMPRKQVIAVPLQGIDGEEICAAWLPGAPVIGHGVMLAVDDMRRNALRLLRLTGCPIPFGRI